MDSAFTAVLFRETEPDAYIQVIHDAERRYKPIFADTVRLS
jgi:hypothetical protein